MPSLSIIVCARNEERFIERCLRSLANQDTRFEYEVIVVDDASTDATPELLTRFDLPNLTVITMKENVGIGAASNEGLRESKGRLVVRVDADDYVSIHFCNTMVVSILEAQAKAVRCDYFTVDESGSFLGAYNSVENPIACGIIFEKDALVEVGLYDPKLRTDEDVELEARFRAKFEILHIPVPLYRYRQHPGNTSGGTAKNL